MEPPSGRSRFRFYGSTRDNNPNAKVSKGAVRLRLPQQELKKPQARVAATPQGLAFLLVTLAAGGGNKGAPDIEHEAAGRWQDILNAGITA